MRSICDLCDDHGDAVRVLQAAFHDFGSLRRFSGEIATVQCLDDNGLVRRVLETPGAGRVLVVDGGGSLRRALVGDKLGALAIASGWVGVVVYGAIRDVETLAGMPIAVRALGISPLPPRREGSGAAGIPVSIAGAVITNGQFLYADENGMIVADQALA